MKIDIDLKGMDKALADLRRTSERAEQAVYDHVLDLAKLAHATAVRGISSGPASGQVYGKRRHRASAPGEYPMQDTGRLAGNIEMEPPTSGERPVAYVGTSLGYGAYLELKPSSKGGRPWLSRAVREAALQLRRDLEKRMR